MNVLVQDDENYKFLRANGIPCVFGESNGFRFFFFFYQNHNYRYPKNVFATTATILTRSERERERERVREWWNAAAPLSRVPRRYRRENNITLTFVRRPIVSVFPTSWKSRAEFYYSYYATISIVSSSAVPRGVYNLFGVRRYLRLQDFNDVSHTMYCCDVSSA
jgi:hypothetical protein